jgi:hypothetical protein
MCLLLLFADPFERDFDDIWVDEATGGGVSLGPVPGARVLRLESRSLNEING